MCVELGKWAGILRLAAVCNPMYMHGGVPDAK